QEQEQEQQQAAFADLILRRREERQAAKLALEQAREQELAMSAEEQSLQELLAGQAVQSEKLAALREQQRQQLTALQAQWAQEEQKLQAAAQEEQQQLAHEHQAAEVLAQTLIQRLRDQRQHHVVWREQVQQVLESAPVTLDTDFAQSEPATPVGLRLRPSILAGLMLCAGMIGAAGFSQLLPVVHASGQVTGKVEGKQAANAQQLPVQTAYSTTNQSVIPAAIQVTNQAENHAVKVTATGLQLSYQLGGTAEKNKIADREDNAIQTAEAEATQLAMVKTK
ncbi:MAG: hypothetical protein ACOYNW_08910, partial [Undibacterium curvum]